MRHLKTALTTLTLAAAQLSAMAATVPVKVYKDPNCGCCELYTHYLQDNGFAVEVVNTSDMASVKQKFGVPERLEGCHTTVVDGYVVEGHVPAPYIARMLEQHRPIKGISVPGMPMGTPGMPGAKPKPLDIYVIDASTPPKVFATF